jgi:hypothetical protein
MEKNATIKIYGLSSINTATKVQLRKYPYSPITIALGD